MKTTLTLLLTIILATIVNAQVQRGYIFQAELDHVCVTTHKVDTCHATKATIEGSLGLFSLLEMNEALIGEIDDGLSLDGCYLFKGKTKDNTPFTIHMKDKFVMVDFQLPGNPLSLLYFVTTKDGFDQITVQKN